MGEGERPTRDAAGPMEGRVCLVTGASSGIGLETARELAARGAHIILLCRDRGRAEAARADVVDTTANERVDVVLADFEHLHHVARAARHVVEGYDRLDVLVNNAGAVLDQQRTTRDGLDAQFQINHLAPFLLTRDLLGLLDETGTEDRRARIVTVASEAHRGARPDPDDLAMAAGTYGPTRAYALTKLYNILFTYALARRLDEAGAPVTATCLHPGVVRTRFGHEGPRLLRLAVRLVAPFMIPASKGARTPVHLAASAGLEGANGRYFVRCRPTTPSKVARDEHLQERLWAESDRLVAERLERNSV